MHAGPGWAVLSTGQCRTVRAAPDGACPWNCDRTHQLPYSRECCRVSYANYHCPVYFKVVKSECTGFTRIYDSQGANPRWRKSLGNQSPEHGWQELCVWLRNPAEAYTHACCTLRDSAGPAKHRRCQQMNFIDYGFRWNSAVSFPAE